MPILQSNIQSASSEYQSRYQAQLELLHTIRDLEAAVIAHSSRAKAKFEKRGKLLPRERVARLIDPGSPFLEIATLAGYQMHDDDGKKNIAGGGNIIGIGYVSGVRCLITASDAAIKGGSISPMGLKKSLRAHEIALQNRLPIVSLVESGGANLLYQAELFVDGGKVFYNMAQLSAAGIPQITVVHGSSTAGGAYMPGLSDYVVMVKNQAQVYLAGPPLVKAAIGEDADSESLGGAEMHATQTGTAEYLAEDDSHALIIARDIVDKLGWNDDHQAPLPPEYKAPRYNAEELLGIVPVSHKKPYDCREVIARLVDDSDFLEFKAAYGETTVCGHARIMGFRCGIIGNNGPIYATGATKAAHFIQACCQSNTPIIYLHNITGYMVGLEAEQSGIVKHGSKMIQAVSNASVPQISILIGGSFGAGNYGMCGRAYNPRFIFSWPNAKISVMGGEQAAKVLEIILVNQLGRTLKSMGLKPEDLNVIAELLKGNPEDWPTQIAESGLKIVPQGLQMLSQGLAAQIKKMGIPIDPTAPKGALGQLIDFIENQFDAQSTALFATARLWDDGIIDPRDTRRVLGETLSICKDAEYRTLYPSHFGVARM
ncbi:MAG: acyl-CoA carboxylase subunit beta [Myxococcota bacterium]